MLLSVFHFYYLGILRLAILLLRIFHRMAHTWKYGARTQRHATDIRVLYFYNVNRTSMRNAF